MSTITDDTNLGYALTFVKTLLGISGTDDDSILSIYIKSAVAKIYEMTGIDLLALGDADGNFVKKFDGAGQRILFLGKGVDSINYVKRNDNPRGTPNWISFDEYSYILKDDGQLVFKDSLPRGYNNIEIEYSLKYTNFNNIPREFTDLTTALALLVGNLVEAQKSTGINSESVSGTTITFGKETMTSNITALLNKYLVIAI